MPLPLDKAQEHARRERSAFLLAAAAVFFVHLFSAFVRPFGKIVALHMASELFLSLRLLLASIFLFTTSYLRGFGVVPPKSTYRLIFISSIFDLCVSKWIFFLSLKTTSISTSAIISATLPTVITHVIDFLVEGKSHLSFRRILAISLACLGSALTIVISMRASHIESRSTLSGVSLCLLSVAIGAVVLISKSRVPRSVSNDLIGAWESLVAGLILGLVSWLNGASANWTDAFQNKEISFALFIYTAYQAITGPLMLWSLKITGASFFAMTKVTLPIFSAILAYFIIGEVLSLGQLGGILIASCGLVMYISV